MTRLSSAGSLFGALALAAAGLGCTTSAHDRANASPAPGATAAPAEKGSGTASDAGRKIEDAAEKTAEAAKEVGRDIQREAGPKAKEIGREVKEAGKEVLDVADAKKQALDIKAALMADEAIDASKIDVDADAKTNTIHISGTVPTAAQKTAVDRIAKQKAAGYAIHNMLTVEAKVSSK